MALEEMFIASAITTIAAVGAFIYLHKTTNDKTRFGEILKLTWLISIFIFLFHGVSILQIGFRDIVVHSQAADLSFTLVWAIMWTNVLLAGYFLLLLIKQIFEWVKEFVTGVSDYEKAEKSG